MNTIKGRIARALCEFFGDDHHTVNAAGYEAGGS